ncbi:MAG: sigma-70 family RNA polymerase sigma factor [bacterium]
MKNSDEELFDRYRAGDRGSFEELLERYRKPLFTVVMRMVRDRQEAEDIFQDTFIRVVKHRDSFDSDRSFSTWVFSIATNLAKDRLRRRKRDPVSMEADPPEYAGGEDPETRTMKNEMKKALEGALESLSPEQKEVFLLREYGGLSFKEIASMKETNLNTVLSRMHLAMKKLRQELSPLAEEKK